MIPTYHRNSTEIDIEDLMFNVGWRATLINVTIKKGGEYEAVYEVESDDY